MFNNLKSVEISAVSGNERIDFAEAYFKQCLYHQINQISMKFEIDLNITVGSGDTRALVRELRMLAFYVCHLAQSKKDVYDKLSDRIVASIHQDETNVTTIKCNQNSIKLKLGSFNNFYPLLPKKFYSSKTDAIVKSAQLDLSPKRVDELAQVIDYFYGKALAPAVVVSRDKSLIEKIIEAISLQKDIQSIKGINPSAYKMMKSLYDPADTPNLRDDILAFGKGTFVAIELICNTKDSQMAIREVSKTFSELSKLPH